MRVGCGAHDTYAVSAERIVHRSTSKMTAVDQPNSSTPSIACRWAEQALVLHRDGRSHGGGDTPGKMKGCLRGWPAVGLVRFQLHLRCRQPSVEIAPANEGPPLVQKYFDWPPVRDPAEDQQALRDEARER